MRDDKFDREMAENRKAYEALREEIRAHKGKYIAMAFGRIVCVSADFDEAVKAIDNLQPEPLSAVVFPADEEPGFEPIEDFHREYL